MPTNIIDEKLKSYASNTIENEEQALKEILQEIALYGLANANFFKKAVFHGGTALRIVHKLPRFSEDLDFLLMEPDPNFKWEIYMDAIIVSCKEFGVHPEVVDKSQVSSTVKKMFLKDNSIGKIINLSFPHQPGRKLAIKFEIDTNPPAGSNNELKFLEFPLDYSIVTQDLASSFAGKCHALLCRQYLKGRDWYDFAWYVARKISPNFLFLENALEQQGPWVKQEQKVTSKWFCDAMSDKIKSIDWDAAKKDVMSFLYERDRQTLALWNSDFFLNKLNKLGEILIK